MFKNPLSDTRRPLSGAFSSRSLGCRGAEMTLKAVAAMVLLTILIACTVSVLLERRVADGRNARDFVRLARAVVVHAKGLSCTGSRRLSHICCGMGKLRGWRSANGGAKCPDLSVPDSSVSRVGPAI